MNSIDIELSHAYIPIKQETIKELGDEFGEATYIIKTWHQYEKFIGFNEETKEQIIKLEVDYNTRIMRIHKTMNNWIADIDGHFFYNYKHEIIVGICKLNIID